LRHKVLSRILTEISRGIRTKLNFSMTFHHTKDGQIERTIQTLEDMLLACILDFKKAWNEHLTLIKLLNNNSYYSNIGMPPFEALYGGGCRTLLCWQIDEALTIGPELIEATTQKVHVIH